MDIIEVAKWRCVLENDLPKFITNLLTHKIDFVLENVTVGADIGFYTIEDYNYACQLEDEG